MKIFFVSPFFVIFFVFFMTKISHCEEGLFESVKLASQNLKQATEKLSGVSVSGQQIDILTKAIISFEDALSIVRQDLRKIFQKKRTIKNQLRSKQESIKKLIGVLYNIEKNFSTFGAIHPKGSMGLARTEIIVGDILPQFQVLALSLKRDLDNLKKIDNLTKESRGILQEGLKSLQITRSQLFLAISERKNLQNAFTEGFIETALLEVASETLEEFVVGLKEIRESTPKLEVTKIPLSKGNLEFPANGQILSNLTEFENMGKKKEGIFLSTEYGALVTTPTDATLIFTGELLNFGMVSILEPEENLLFIYAGMEKVFGNPGEVVPAGNPIGIMGGSQEEIETIINNSFSEDGTYPRKKLYIEIRRDMKPEDPLAWFKIEKDGKLNE